MARNIGYEFSDDNLSIACIERRLARILAALALWAGDAIGAANVGLSARAHAGTGASGLTCSRGLILVARR